MIKKIYGFNIAHVPMGLYIFFKASEKDINTADKTSLLYNIYI